MLILDKAVTREELSNLAENFYGDIIKGVVDVERGLLAIDEVEDDDFLEFDSLINIKPRQDNRSRDVESEEIREKIRQIVNKYVAQNDGKQ